MSKFGSYGTSCFKGKERFAPERKATTTDADFYVPDTTTKKRAGGYVSHVPRFRDPHAATTADAEFFVPKGMGDSKKGGIKMRPGNRFGKPHKAATSDADLYTPSGFVDSVLKKKTGKNAFGTGDRFRKHEKPATTADASAFYPPGFADVAVQKAKRSHTPNNGRVGERFHYAKSATADAEFYSPPSSVVIGNHKGKFSKADSRMAKSPRPASADADFFVPDGCGSHKNVSVPRMRTGTTPRFRDANAGQRSETQDADYYVPSPQRSPCPAAANFKTSAPRFGKGVASATQNADFHDPPTFVDLILKK